MVTDRWSLILQSLLESRGSCDTHVDTSLRLKHWEKHRSGCSFSRINSLCKEVIMKSYVNHGWNVLSSISQEHLLHYCTISSLVRECKEPSLVALCRRYDPREKFILSASIIVDIEQCPRTPPPARID
ncbi:hypothetical protein RB195_023280 [Necator americanus]|uniref:Apical junction molecule ajm1 alpha/beta domain-containing protein n=1 Tax=Necator americanus TaxID=51031 RepID=A0ABR1EIS1_NECAM